MVDQVFAPGEVAGDYSADWWKTFDLAFLIGWMITVAVLGIVMFLIEPHFFRDYRFIAFGALKLAIIVLMALAGGLLCRHFCAVDAKGYIVTTKSSWFKVNYTRKMQHFAAYLVPLINIGEPGPHAPGVLQLFLCFTGIFTIWGS